MAEAVGFEPTCPCGQLHFECSSLQPLRYASMYKYSLLGTNHMISSQGRYDHFDTLPYVITPFILHYSRRKSKGIRRRDAKNGKLFCKTAKKELTIPSRCGNIIKLSKANALLAQLDRASGYGPEGQGFESLTARHSATGYPLWRFFLYTKKEGTP